MKCNITYDEFKTVIIIIVPIDEVYFGTKNLNLFILRIPFLAWDQSRIAKEKLIDNVVLQCRFNKDIKTLTHNVSVESFLGNYPIRILDQLTVREREREIQQLANQDDRWLYEAGR